MTYWSSSVTEEPDLLMLLLTTKEFLFQITAFQSSLKQDQLIHSEDFFPPNPIILFITSDILSSLTLCHFYIFKNTCKRLRWTYQVSVRWQTWNCNNLWILDATSLWEFLWVGLCRLNESCYWKKQKRKQTMLQDKASLSKHIGIITGQLESHW